MGLFIKDFHSRRGGEHFADKGKGIFRCGLRTFCRRKQNTLDFSKFILSPFGQERKEMG